MWCQLACKSFFASLSDFDNQFLNLFVTPTSLLVSLQARHAHSLRITTMSIELKTSSHTQESPVTVEALQAILELVDVTDPKSFCEAVANKLAVKSSKHKFLVLTSSIDAPVEPNADLSIATSFAAVWDSDKDGFCCFQITGESTHLVTVYWIYVG